jgi:hypothetical protein
MPFLGGWVKNSQESAETPSLAKNQIISPRTEIIVRVDNLNPPSAPGQKLLSGWITLIPQKQLADKFAAVS